MKECLQHMSMAAPTIARGNLQAAAGVVCHWTGPHKIVDKLSPVAYRIKIRQGRSKPVLRWVHRNQIKRHQGSSQQEKGEDQTH